MEPIIRLTNLQKTFKVAIPRQGLLGSVINLFAPQHRIVRAVDGISFTVNPGEFIGYIGPNGAGKSTTLKILTGLLVPSGGEVIVNGFVPWRERRTYVSHIGAVFGQRTTLWWDLPVIDSLGLLKHIYNIPHTTFQKNLKEFCELLDLQPFLDAPVRSLSLGQRMRADLAAALLHNPTLLFLDEPTIGLDVIARERIRNFIQYINQQRGVTVLLTTHDLSDVERLCERVLIIDHGRLVYDGHLSDLVQQYSDQRKLIVDLAEDYPDVAVEGARILSREGRRVIYHFRRKEISASQLIQQVSAKYRILDLQVREPDIENTIRRIYEERLLTQDSKADQGYTIGQES